MLDVLAVDREVALDFRIGGLEELTALRQRNQIGQHVGLGADLVLGDNGLFKSRAHRLLVVLNVVLVVLMVLMVGMAILVVDSAVGESGLGVDR